MKATTEPVHPAGGLRIGLTGGIGSGKSTVASILVGLGALLVDTDAIARELTAAGGAALPALKREFGTAVIGPDGALDRGQMRTLAFSAPDARRRLEAILHPMISAEALARAATEGTRPVVFDVPLLAESGHWRDRVHRVLVIDCSEQTQVDRVMRRSGWTEDAVRRVIAQQSPRSARRAIADAVILNDGITLPELQREVETIWRTWTGASV